MDHLVTSFQLNFPIAQVAQLTLRIVFTLGLEQWSKDLGSNVECNKTNERTASRHLKQLVYSILWYIFPGNTHDL